MFELLNLNETEHTKCWPRASFFYACMCYTVQIYHSDLHPQVEKWCSIFLWCTIYIFWCQGWILSLCQLCSIWFSFLPLCNNVSNPNKFHFYQIYIDIQCSKIYSIVYIRIYQCWNSVKGEDICFLEFEWFWSSPI